MFAPVDVSAPTKNRRKTASTFGSRWMVEPRPSIVNSEAIAGSAAGPNHDV